MRIPFPRTAAAGLALVSLAAGLGAQGAIATESTFFSPWPESTATPAQFVRAVAGRFGQDDLPDLVVLRDADGDRAAVYQPNTHRFNGAYPVGSQPARDIATLPGVAPGGRDGVLVLSAAGLELHWAATGQSLTPVATDTDSAWQTAQRVWVVRSQNGDPTVLGLDASGSYILRSTWNGSAFVPAAPFWVAGAPTDLQSIDYDGNGERELMLWIDPFVLITDWAGVPVDVVVADLGAGTGGSFERSAVVVPGATAGAPLERDLVVLYGYSDEATDYRAVAFNADAGPFSIPLGGVPANHQTAADVDGDGLVDVLLSRSDTSELFVLRRTNAATPFAATGAPNQLPLPLPSGVADAGIDFTLAGDIDGDGDTDVLAFQNAHAQIYTALANVVADRHPLIDTDSEALPPGTLELSVGRPGDWNAMVGLQPGTLMIRVEGWAQPNSSDPTLSTRRIDQRVPALFSPTVATQQVAIAYDGSGLTPGDYVLQLHVSIVCDVGGSITAAFPSRLTYYTPNSTYAAVLRTEVAQQRAAPFDPGEGDGDISGNKGNNQSITPPPD